MLSLRTVYVSQVLDLFQSIEHLALTMTDELMLIDTTVVGSSHKGTICIPHILQVLIDTRVNLVPQVLLQARILLFVLSLEHIFDSFYLDSAGVYLLSVEKVGRHPTVLLRLQSQRVLIARCSDRSAVC